MAQTMSASKRALLVAGILLMAAGFTFSGYGGSVATPQKLAQIGGSDYYALCSALSTMGMMLALPMVGWLSGRFGPKVVAVCGMAFQFVMRLGAMLAAGPPAFIVAITLSNIGAGLYVSLSYTLVSAIVPEKARPRYFGFITTCNALGALAGPLMVGQVVDRGHAGLGFVLYAPLCLLGGVLIAALYPWHRHGTQAKAGFDFGGILLLVAGIGCIVLWLSLGGKGFAWLSGPSALLLVGGAAALVGLVKHESRRQNPAVALHMFRKKRFTTAFLCMALMVSYSTCAAGFCIYYAQQIMQVSSRLSATVTMPQTIVQAVCGVAIGRLLSRNFAGRFRYFAVVAPVLTTIAAFLLFTLTPSSSMLVIYAATTLGGVGMAIAQTAFAPFFQTELEPSEIAEAQGMYTFGSNGGSCIFAALAGVLLNRGLGYNHIFLMGCLFNVLAVVIGFAGFRLPGSPRAQGHSEPGPGAEASVP